jgi:hypothetical protein
MFVWKFRFFVKTTKQEGKSMKRSTKIVFVISVIAILVALIFVGSIHDPEQFVWARKVMGCAALSLFFILLVTTFVVYTTTWVVSSALVILTICPLVILCGIWWILPSIVYVEIPAGSYIMTPDYRLVEEQPMSGKRPMKDLIGLSIHTYGEEVSLSNIFAEENFPDELFKLVASPTFDIVRSPDDQDAFAHFMQNQAIVGNAVAEKLSWVTKKCLDNAPSMFLQETPDQVRRTKWGWIEENVTTCMQKMLTDTGVYFMPDLVWLLPRY